jgi:hypothetical protein
VHQLWFGWYDLSRSATLQDPSQIQEDVHQNYNDLLKEYPFQEVRTQRGRRVNIILVRAAMNTVQRRLFEKYAVPFFKIYVRVLGRKRIIMYVPYFFT